MSHEVGEFDSSWPGWQFATTPEGVEERMLDPEGGIALVETGIDVHPLLTAVETNAKTLIQARCETTKAGYNPRSEANWYWHIDEKEENSSLELVFSGATELLRGLAAVTREIKRPTEAALRPPEGVYYPRPTHVVAIGLLRRTQLRPTHIDYWRSTIWLGATKPGLKVLHNGEWVQIDDVPSGHGLWWRGAYTHNQSDHLPATQHQAQYRSRTPRVVALG